jgi:hypothetical protein
MRGLVLGASVLCVLALPLGVLAQDDTGGGGGGGAADTGSSYGTGGDTAQGGAAQSPPPPPPQREVVVVREQAPPAAPREEERKPVFYIEAGGGYSYVDLRAFNDENFIPEVERLSGSGWTFQGAAGLRLAFLYFGGHVSLASYRNFEVGTAVIEAGLRLITESVEPWIRVGIGYGWQGDANYEEPRISSTSVYGVVFNGAFGLDIFVSRILAIGAGLEMDLLNLSRQRVDMGDAVDEVNFSEDGDALGFQGRLQVHIGLHI